jgi:hypothetical protein
MSEGYLVHGYRCCFDDIRYVGDFDSSSIFVVSNKECIPFQNSVIVSSIIGTLNEAYKKYNFQGSCFITNICEVTF